MATERFPRRKYMRQLYEMADDCAWWRASYMQAAQQTTSDHLAGRFSGRAYVLEDICHQLEEVAKAISGLPRIS